MFEIPLQNMVVAPGTDVLLKCIITANPPPEGEQQGEAEVGACGTRRRFSESFVGELGGRGIPHSLGAALTSCV